MVAPCLRRLFSALFTINILRNIGLWFLLSGLPVTASLAADAQLLTLSGAEMLALQNDNATKKARAQQESFKEQAIAANSWPDPKLTLGIANLPSTFDIQQEAMTQTVVGVSQMLPPWGALGAKSNQLQDMSDAMGHAAKNRRLMTLAAVRKSWLDVYLQHQSLLLIKESLDVFGELIQVTQFQYRAGRGNQQDVIRAQLEQNLLEDKVSAIESNYESAVAVLTKWLGVKRSVDELDMQLPTLAKLPSQQVILRSLDEHPATQVREMRVKAAENGVNYASSQLHPGLALKLQYGFRVEDASGNARDDLLTAMLTVDLPLFTQGRQDRTVAASKQEVTAAQRDLDDWRREMNMQFEKAMAVYKRADERVQLYQASVIPHSRQNTEATLKAYQSGVTDFNVLVRARLTELTSQLQFVKLNVERAKAQVELLYLAAVD